MKEKKTNSLKYIVCECWKNRYRLIKLSIYELKVRNSGTWFGFLWNFLNPALQIFVYWFVFAIGLKTSAPKEGYSYLIWMIMGIIPWFYISEAMNGSTMAIYSFLDVLKRMRFPVAIVPVKTVLTALLSHIMAMAVVMIIFFASGYSVGIHALDTLYFMFASFVFLMGYAFLASTITVVFKDFQKIMGSVIRLLFYISPVVWAYNDLPESLKFVLKFNPLTYLVEGYRESILYNLPFTTHWLQGIYFWCVTLVLLLLGCSLHMRLRKRFMDVI